MHSISGLNHGATPRPIGRVHSMPKSHGHTSWMTVPCHARLVASRQGRLPTALALAQGKPPARPLYRTTCRAGRPRQPAASLVRLRHTASQAALSRNQSRRAANRTTMPPASCTYGRSPARPLYRATSRAGLAASRTTMPPASCNYGRPLATPPTRPLARPLSPCKTSSHAVTHAANRAPKAARRPPRA